MKIQIEDNNKQNMFSWLIISKDLKQMTSFWEQSDVAEMCCFWIKTHDECYFSVCLKFDYFILLHLLIIN